MEFDDSLQDEILRFAEKVAAERGLEGAAKDEALITIIEEVAVVVGDQVARAIMRKRLEVDQACADLRCPDCGTAGFRKRQRKRKILTRRGEVEFTEPECYCRKCRRSFFPSVARLETGRGL